MFLSNRGGSTGVYGAYADGSDPVLLASGIVAEGNAAPSPNGAVIAFVQQPATPGSAGNNVITTVDAYGGNVTHIGSTLDRGSYVEWSPDGSTLAVGDRGGQQLVPTTVYTIKRNGQIQQLMGYADVGALNSGPSWSPDSSRVAFVSISPNQSAAVAIWIVNSDGSHGIPVDEQGYLPAPPTYYLTPRWSPNGNVIAYLTNEKGNLDIVLKTVNGSAGRVLATPDTESDIAWSHDSTKIAFVRTNGANHTIWVMNADGTAPMPLIAGEHPRWSPDDQYLLFDTSRDGNREIYSMKSDGTNPINLTNDPGDDSQAEWAACPN